MADDNRGRTERRAAKLQADREVDKLLEKLRESIPNISDVADELSKIMTALGSGTAVLTSRMKANYGEMEKYLTQQERLYEDYTAQAEVLDKIKLQYKTLNERMERTALALKNEQKVEAGTIQFLKKMISANEFKSIAEGIAAKINLAPGNEESRRAILAEMESTNANLKGLITVLDNGEAKVKSDITEEQLEKLLEVLAIPKKEGRWMAEYNSIAEGVRDILETKLGEANKNLKDLTSATDREIQERAKKADEQSRAVALQRREGATIANDILKSMGINKHVQNLGDAVAKFGADAKELGAILEKAAKNIQESLTFGNIMLQANQKGSELFGSSVGTNISAYDNTVEFMKGIGQDRSTMGDTIDDTMIALRKLNITSRETIGIQRELFRTMSDFSELGKDAKIALTQQAAILERIGVNSSTSAKLFQSLTKSMGVKDLAGMSSGMANFARALGVNADKTMNDFTSNLSQFLRYGPSSIDVFKELAVVVKRTGVEMGDLIGIAKGFDTFEGAADKVGQLNAILGGPFLNTMQFINETNHAKRIEMIADAIRKSGKNISEYYTSDALASMLGAKDVETLNRLMGNSVKGIQEQVRATDQLGQSLKSLDQVAGVGNVTSEQFRTTTMENIAGVGAFNNTIQKSIATMTSMASVTQFVGMGLQGMTLVTNILGMSALANALKVDTLTLSLKRVGMALKAAGIVGGLVGLGHTVANLATGESTGSEWLGAGMSAVGLGLMAFGGPIGLAAGAALSLGGSAVSGFASGTDNAPGGLSLVGENGPELVVLPQHSSVVNNRNLNRLATSSNNSSSTMNNFGGGGGPISFTVIVKLDNDVLARHTEEIVLDTMEKTMNIVLN